LVFSARRCCRRSRVRAPVWPGTFLRKNIIITLRILYIALMCWCQFWWPQTKWLFWYRRIWEDLSLNSTIWYDICSMKHIYWCFRAGFHKCWWIPLKKSRCFLKRAWDDISWNGFFCSELRNCMNFTVLVHEKRLSVAIDTFTLLYIQLS
jgi:hypothetical protein